MVSLRVRLNFLGVLPPSPSLFCQRMLQISEPVLRRRISFPKTSNLLEYSKNLYKHVLLEFVRIYTLPVLYCTSRFARKLYHYYFAFLFFVENGLVACFQCIFLSYTFVPNSGYNSVIGMLCGLCYPASCSKCGCAHLEGLQYTIWWLNRGAQT